MRCGGGEWSKALGCTHNCRASLRTLAQHLCCLQWRQDGNTGASGTRVGAKYGAEFLWSAGLVEDKEMDDLTELLDHKVKALTTARRRLRRPRRALRSCWPATPCLQASRTPSSTRRCVPWLYTARCKCV